MSLVYRHLFSAMWLAWIAYWLLSSSRVKPTERREPLPSRLLHIVPLVLAFALLWPDNFPIALLRQRLYPWALWQFWAGAAVVAVGLFFSVWARVHLGGNWSGT